MSFPKGKTSYTLFVHAFFFGEKGSEEKPWGITIKISEPEQETPFVCNPSEIEAQKKTPVADSMSCFPPKEKPAKYSFMLPPPESPGQEKSMPHDPDTVPQHRSRIYPLSTFFPT